MNKDVPKSSRSTPAEPAHELHGQGIVEPQPVAQRGDLLGCGVRSEEHRRRVAGREVHQAEDHGTDDQENRRYDGQSSHNEDEHRANPSVRGRVSLPV